MTSPVSVRMVVSDRASGAAGGEVQVTMTRTQETIPVITSDVPLQMIVVLGDTAAGDAGRCGQSDFRADLGFPDHPECTFNKAATDLTCRVRR